MTIPRRAMKRLMVYSHDTYGLGNARRMLSICEHLSREMPELTILFVTGSPMAHGFRLAPRLDYIKLPSLTRAGSEDYAVKSLDMKISEAIRLRSDLILAAAANFKPDLLLVDKKPFGVKNELGATLKYLEANLPAARRALVLRDILDAPEETIRVWERQRYSAAIESFYDLVLVLGDPSVFDPRAEYRFSKAVSDRVRFCGYLKRGAGDKCRAEVRAEMRLSDQDKLALVTVGGGQDGYRLLAAYLEGLDLASARRGLHSLIFSGPEMARAQRESLLQAAASRPEVRVPEFTDDLMSYMDAADVVVSMGGYNTICEILSLRKKSVIVPRCRPVREQLIRAERMSRLNLFKMIHPDQLTARRLMNTLLEQLDCEQESAPLFELEAQSQVAHWVSSLLYPGSAGILACLPPEVKSGK
ncbi:MAG: glycosyltransferase family protein [Blastocatellia bacterium]